MQGDKIHPRASVHPVPPDLTDPATEGQVVLCSRAALRRTDSPARHGSARTPD